MKVFYILALFLGLGTGALAQNAAKLPDWRDIKRALPPEWYGSEQAASIADTLIKYQMTCGGWIKNQNWSGKIKYDEIYNAQHSGFGATIDNGATVSELKFLARVYASTKRNDIREAFVKGLNYLMAMQYANGGFPQVYPARPTEKGKTHYSAHITYNDNAIYHVLRLFKNICDDKEPYKSLEIDRKTKDKLKKQFDKGIACILKCQIKVGGKPSVWCQQHDEKTLAPIGARSYELASLTGAGETVYIIRLLMSIKKPSKEVIYSIECAIDWLKSHAIKDTDVEYFKNSDGMSDCRQKTAKGAPLLWARFYDLETGQPYVCDRDGVKKNDMSEIGYERRNGYRWYGRSPQMVLDNYDKWKEELGK